MAIIRSMTDNFPARMNKPCCRDNLSCIFASMSGKINILSRILMLPVYFYRFFISPLKGPSCRHVPSCSAYAIEALKIHGPWRGLVMGTGRILRCRPGGTHGFDPVPRFIFRRYKPLMTVTGRWKRCNRLKTHPPESSSLNIL